MLTVGVWEVDVVQLFAQSFIGGDHNVLTRQSLRLDEALGGHTSVHLKASQSINQSTNQAISQSINQWIGRSVSQSAGRLFGRSVGQSVSQSINQLSACIL